MKVFYSKSMVADIGRHTSPSSIKPQFVAEALRASGLPVVFVEPEPVTPQVIALAHSQKFVNQILSGEICNGFGNKSPEVIRSLPFTSGSMLCSALAALKDGVACSLTSGFHHAGYSHAGGFCTFNGLMITARYLLTNEYVNHVAIIDCDQHFGDGTENIIKQFGHSDITHISLGKWYHSPNDAVDYLNRLRKMDSEFVESRPDIILYQAGADVHVNDPLGGVLTTEQMRERDEIVFGMAKRLGIPIAWNLAGGYQRDANGGISSVVSLHVNTAEIACSIFHDPKDQVLFRGTYQITSWGEWDKTVHEAVADFKKRCRLIPNLLMASDQTFRRVDLAANANRQNIAGDDRLAPPESVPFIELSGFGGNGYILDMVIGNQVPMDSFLLIYDSDPDGGLPFPEVDNLPVRKKRKSRARVVGE